MKKLLLLLIIILGFTYVSYAQNVSRNAIGLRLGDSNGFGAEISYQRGLSTNSRLEFDLGWSNPNNSNNSAFRFVGLYQWVMRLDGNINWYVGAGAGIADKVNTFAFLAGNIGIEYDFEIPLLISLDFRPEIDFGDDTLNNDTLDFDIALGFRYQF